MATEWFTVTIPFQHPNGQQWRPGPDYSVTDPGLRAWLAAQPDPWGGKAVTWRGVDYIALPAQGADRIVFWDHSAGGWAALQVGGGLQIDGALLRAADVIARRDAPNTFQERGTFNGGVVAGPNSGGVAATSTSLPLEGSYNNSFGAHAYIAGSVGYLARVDHATSFLAYWQFGSSGAVGTITTNGSATAYNTTSDETLKNFVGEFAGDDAAAIIRADPVRRFTWKADGAPAVGWGAQTSYAVSTDLATPGRGWIDPVTGENWQEDGERWVDQETGQPADPHAPNAICIAAIYDPWGVDQAKRTPYLWAALSWALDRIDAPEARLTGLESAG